MKRMMAVLCAGVLAMTSLPATADPTLKETVKNLTTIASPKFGKRTETRKRFRFVLPMLVEDCSDIGQAVRAGDMIAYTYQKLDEAGLASEEGLLPLTNNLHRMTSTISSNLKSSNVPVKCAEIWAMYLSVRLRGMAPAEARRGVEQVVKSLYAAVKR